VTASESSIITARARSQSGRGQDCPGHRRPGRQRTPGPGRRFPHCLRTQRAAGQRHRRRHRGRTRQAGSRPVRREGRSGGRWVLLDYADIVIHVQHEEDRVFYALERLWKDCPVVDLQLGDDASAKAPAASDAGVATGEPAEYARFGIFGNAVLRYLSCFGEIRTEKARRAAIIRGCGAAGSAPAWHAGGQGFESPQLHRSILGRTSSRARQDVGDHLNAGEGRDQRSGRRRRRSRLGADRAVLGLACSQQLLCGL
jgi:hypothetical protein